VTTGEAHPSGSSAGSDGSAGSAAGPGAASGAGPEARASEATPVLAPLLLLTVAAGALISVQARINAALALRIDSAVLSAALSFGVGLLMLATVAVVVPRARRTLRGARWGQSRPWYFLGGLGGAAAVTSAAAAVPVTGTAAFTVAIVSGQVVGGLLVDRVGLGPGGMRALTRARVLGAVLAVCAIVVSAVGKHESGSTAAVSAALSASVLLVLAGAAGVGVSAQQAVNGRLRVATGSVLAATVVNFVIGTLALATLWLLLTSQGASAQPLPGQWWLYLGGPIGVAFIAMMAFVVPTIGVFRQGLAVLAGMLTGALLLDLWVPAEAAGRPGPATFAGIALAVLAVGVVGREQRSVVRPSRRGGV
jgi:transporter family-2 protein